MNCKRCNSTIDEKGEPNIHVFYCDECLIGVMEAIKKIDDMLK